jgi:hypothetical protein
MCVIAMIDHAEGIDFMELYRYGCLVIIHKVLIYI